LSSAAPSSSSTPTSQSPSTIASSSSSLRFPAPGSLSSSTTTTTTTTTSTTTRAPLFSTGLQQQHAQPIYPGQRSVSPSLSNGSPAPLRSSAALGPALYGSPSSTAPTSASIASTAVYNAPVQTSGTATMSTSQFTGAGIYNMGGAGPGSGGLGGRGGAFQAQQYNEHAQYQQELFYEDEREQLKKNARPAFNGSAPFLNKALHSAQQLPLICLLWYLSSAVTNNIGKQIMNQFRYPVTLTFVQFVFVSLFCFFLGMAPGSTTRIQRPTRAIVQMTAPLVGFQVVGHVFSSIAISRVPLSVVHTIK
ncbi:suppressor of loss of ypt1, partial [Lunasporangiospora selenospora]